MYTTEEDVQQVITPITGNGRGGWTLEPEDIAHHILDAQAEIDVRLGSRYAVPFADVEDDPPTPSVIREICQDIAAYLASLQANGEASLDANDAVVRRYERKHQLLLDLQNGVIDLPGVDDSEASAFIAINTDRTLEDRHIPRPWWV